MSLFKPLSHIRTGIDPLILNLGSRWKLVVNLTSRPFYSRGKSSTASFEQETGWISEPVWTFSRRRQEQHTLSVPGYDSRIVQPLFYSLYWLRRPDCHVNVRYSCNCALSEVNAVVHRALRWTD